MRIGTSPTPRPGLLGDRRCPGVFGDLLARPHDRSALQSQKFHALAVRALRTLFQWPARWVRRARTMTDRLRRGRAVSPGPAQPSVAAPMERPGTPGLCHRDEDPTYRDRRSWGQSADPRTEALMKAMNGAIRR